MNVRIIKVCKENLDIALQHSTWANKRNRMLLTQPIVGKTTQTIWKMV